MNKTVKIQLFYDTLTTLTCDIESRVNTFLARDDIEVLDVKVSNSSSKCVVCVLYKPKEPEKLGKWVFKDTDNVYVQDICCSKCGGKALYPDEKDDDSFRPLETEYCPHCGSKMDL